MHNHLGPVPAVGSSMQRVLYSRDRNRRVPACGCRYHRGTHRSGSAVAGPRHTGTAAARPLSPISPYPRGPWYQGSSSRSSRLTAPKSAIPIAESVTTAAKTSGVAVWLLNVRIR